MSGIFGSEEIVPPDAVVHLMPGETVVFNILWECPIGSHVPIFEPGFHCNEYGHLEAFGSAYFRHPLAKVMNN